MIDWRKRGKTATFRGVPFLVDTQDQTGGRAVVVHDYPFSESAPFTEDLGKKGKAFNVTGFVLGADYISEGRRLRVALDEAGPGELVHPVLGTRRVAVPTYRITESGGVAQFSIDFIATSTKPANPSSTVDTKANLATKVDAARVASMTAYLGKHSQSPFVLGSLVLPALELAMLISAVDVMSQTLARLPVDPQLHASFKRLFAEPLTGPFDSTAAYVGAVLESLFDGLASALLTVTVPLDVSGALLALYGFNPGVRPSSVTPARAIEQADFDSLQHLIQRFAITYASSAAATQVFTTYDEAVRVRTAITTAIDLNAEVVTDDSFPALADLRGALVEALPGPDTDLPRIQRYTPIAVVPSLVLAHTLYGDLDREEDLIQRNRVRHPAFIRGDLEILSP